MEEEHEEQNGEEMDPNALEEEEYYEGRSMYYNNLKNLFKWKKQIVIY